VNPAKAALADGRYLCSRCNVPKPASEYYPSQGPCWCKECYKARSRLYRSEDRRGQLNWRAYRKAVRQYDMETEHSGVLMLQAWAISR
jgi:recombinational DNA repair protein (RecF pathway)